MGDTMISKIKEKTVLLSPYHLITLSPAVSRLFCLITFSGLSPVFAEVPNPNLLLPDQVLPLMEQEMSRSMKELRLEEFGPPYYSAYRLEDQKSVQIQSQYGSTSQHELSRSPVLFVEVRFGDYSLDNTQESHDGIAGYAPVDLDRESFRRTLWILTDDAYKKAVADFLWKKAKRAQELDREKLPDFSTAAVTRAETPAEDFPWDTALWAGNINKISAAGKKHSHLTRCEVILKVTQSHSYFLDSEGTRLSFASRNNPFSLYLSAEAVSPDGMPLSVERAYFAPAWDRLPKTSELIRELDRMAQDLRNLQKAEKQKPFTAPAILDPQCSSTLMHEALGHRLEGENQREEGGQTFKAEVGNPILPEFLSLMDDPSLKDFKGHSLNGFYPFDSEGVKARRVLLVEKGILRNFLMSRRPIKGFDSSNGHGRAAPHRRAMSRMGNLMLSADKTLTASQMKKELISLCRAQNKPFGFRIEYCHSGDTTPSRASSQVLRIRPEKIYRIDAKTGEETLARGVTLVGTPMVTVGKIAAAGDDSRADNSYCGADSGFIPVGHVAPSLLLREVELESVPEDRQRPPILPPPPQQD